MKECGLVAEMQEGFEEYLKNLNLNILFGKLGAFDPEVLAREVEHFSVKEAMRRDEILVNYFGWKSLNRIVDRIVEFLFASPSLPTDAKLLDVGAGSGFSLLRLLKKCGRSFQGLHFTPWILLRRCYFLWRRKMRECSRLLA